MYRVLLPRRLWADLDAHMRAAGRVEDGAFVLVRSGRGTDGVRLIAHELLLPPADAWESRGRDRLRPSGQWLSAVIGAAIETRSGIAFVHSHPQADRAWLSPIDRSTSAEWSHSLLPTLQRSFTSLVWTPYDIAGCVFESDDPARPVDVDQIAVLGDGRIEIVGPKTDDEVTEEEAIIDDRQRRALGTLGNRALRELSVGIVGAGGTGSPLADQLARMGVRSLVIIDSDRIDTPSNLRRIVGSRASDAAKGVAKVSVASRHLAETGLGVQVTALERDVRTEVAARALLDCDVVFSTTDTHSSRATVNQLAEQYYLPVIDIGVKVGTSLTGAVTGMPADLRVLMPDAGCLWCTGVLDPSRIRAENLPANERDREVREGYIQAVDDPQPSLAPLNWFAASLAGMILLQLIGPGIAAPRTIADGWEHYFADSDAPIDTACVCQQWRAFGDEIPVAYLPE